MRALLIAALTLTTTPALADGSSPWRAGVRNSYLVMGADRPTGGLMPIIEATRAWELREGLSLAMGGTLGLSVDRARWMAALGGPVVAVRGRPWAVPLELEGRVHLDFGRLPTCNQWGLCLNYSGFYPALAAALTYLPSERVSLAASCSARVVRTLGWSGASIEPSVAGSYAF